MILFSAVALVFLVGIFFSAHFFWCHWLGFAGLWFLYGKRRGRFLKGFLIPCWIVFLVVYAAYLYWLLKYSVWVYLVCAAGLSLLCPGFFFLHHLVTQRSKSVLADAAAAFGIFFLLELSLSRVPFMGTAPLDPFFQPPIEILKILHFIDFKIWSAWVMATCFMAAALTCKRSWKMLVVMSLSLITMGILIGLGNGAVRFEKKTNEHSPKIALIQHNLPFSEEWRSGHPGEVKRKYEALAMEASKKYPDLIIFPQYTFPEDIYREPDFFTQLARKTKTHILVATHVPAEAGKSVFEFGFMNVALLFTPEGKLGGMYQSVEEAPFGEIRQRSAKKYQVIGTPFGKLGILLCYEDVTGQVAHEAVKAGASILISLSNPGMFLRTHMPYYHLQQDQLRVMETGLPLVRVSPNGYSAFIDKTGHIVQKTRLNAETILNVEY